MPSASAAVQHLQRVAQQQAEQPAPASAKAAADGVTAPTHSARQLRRAGAPTYRVDDSVPTPRTIALDTALPEPVLAGPLAQLAPIVRRYPAHGGLAEAVEFEWQPQHGFNAAGIVAQHTPAWLLRSTKLPVVVTYVHLNGRLVPWALVAESVALRLSPKPIAPQLGHYMLRAMDQGDTMEYLRGRRVGGNFRAGSGAQQRAAARANRGAGHCFLFEVRGSSAGSGELWDGAADRIGGGRSANSNHGIKRRVNAVIGYDPRVRDDDATLHASRHICAVSAASTIKQMQANETLWNYGSDFVWHDENGADA